MNCYLVVVEELSRHDDLESNAVDSIIHTIRRVTHGSKVDSER